jgi:hypothetical protein
MDERLKRVQELVERPSESLNVELKRWIDPDAPEGQAKIVQAVLALRNQNGGHLIIGIDNDSLKPDKANVPANVKTKFHADKIQSFVSKYASELFSIDVDFPEIDGQACPVITVPSGVKTPVASKSDLIIDGKPKVSVNDVYVRTLNSNNLVSSAKIPWKDWPRIMEICFDNREADIGRFLRRHIGKINLQTLKDISAEIQNHSTGNQATMNERLERYREACFTRATALFAEHSPTRGCFEAALFFDGIVPPRPTDADFRQLLAVNNPRHTGWTPWFVEHQEGLPGFPRIVDDSWEHLVIRQRYDKGIPEYMRLNAEGKFYHCRGFQEDYEASNPNKNPPSCLDIDLLIARIAEIMSVGRSFAIAMECSPVSTKLCFLFRWSGLTERRLVRYLPRLGGDVPEGGVSVRDSITSFVEVPLETPLSALGDYIERPVENLCLAFGGHLIVRGSVENSLREFLRR